jgi:hypothetical protein
MEKSVQFIQYTPDQLQTEITAGVKRQLDEFLTHFKPIQPAEYLTRNQVAKMFDVDLSTVHNWCKSGKLNPLGLGSRVYFLRSDIDACLIPLNNGIGIINLKNVS